MLQCLFSGEAQCWIVREEGVEQIGELWTERCRCSAGGAGARGGTTIALRGDEPVQLIECVGAVGVVLEQELTAQRGLVLVREGGGCVCICVYVYIYVCMCVYVWCIDSDVYVVY